MPENAPSDQQRAAEMYALASDENFRNLLAWRFVKARCEADPGAFNGLLISDLQHAGQVLEWIETEAAKPVRRDPFGQAHA